MRRTLPVTSATCPSNGLAWDVTCRPPRVAKNEYAGILWCIIQAIKPATEKKARRRGPQRPLRAQGAPAGKRQNQGEPMSSANAASVEYGVAPLKSDDSRRFGAFAAGTRYEDLPEAVRHECKRGVLDWLGCALAGSRHKTIDVLLAGLDALGSRETVPVIGRGARLGAMEAAIANGQIGHVLDFDDTHMDGVVLHTSSPVLSALLSAAYLAPIDGRTLMTAYALGFEAGVRVGKSAPGHHDGGWHLTGTLGSIAAGVATARLLGLDARQTTYALGVATTQAGGMQQNRGTMSKSFHAGRAGANGLVAALLAREGFDSSEEIVEGRRGFARTYSATTNIEAFTAELGERWEIVNNGYKPYACGIVLHPLIDGAIALHRRGLDPANVAGIELQVHPHTIRITGVIEPQTGLQSKFSLYHSAAVAFLDGAAGLAQYTDARATAPEVVATRALVSVAPVDAFRKDEAHVAAVMKDGTRHEVHVDHAVGTRDNPMSDEALEGKFTGNALTTVSASRAREIADRVWSLDGVEDVRDLVALCA
jgi:2-methylcitrate dehydratase PrpD